MTISLQKKTRFDETLLLKKVHLGPFTTSLLNYISDSKNDTNDKYRFKHLENN